MRLVEWLANAACRPAQGICLMASDISNPPVPARFLVSTVLLNSPDPNVYSMTDGVVRSDRNMPIDAVLELAERDALWINRGKAIQSYATLEQSLCSLLADLAGLNFEAAATIFYRIVNSGSKIGILERLLHKKHETKFNPFWNQYFRDLRQIDLKRNAIIHWLVATRVRTQ